MTWRHLSPAVLALLAALAMACGGGDDGETTADSPTATATQAAAATEPPSTPATLSPSPSPSATLPPPPTRTPTPVPNVELFACGFNRPSALAFAPDGNLYVANKTDAYGGDGRTISMVTPAGEVFVFVTDLKTNFLWVVGPVDLAFDGTGDLLVSDTGPPRVFRLLPGGVPSPFLSGFEGQVLMGLDQDDGGLYVSHRGSIEKYDSNGVLVIASDVAFEPPTTPHSPFPIAVDDARDRVYIGNNFGSVYAMDQTAGTIEQVLEADDLKSEFAVGAVRDLTMGPDGFLYMTARGVVRGFDRVLRADPSDWSVSIFVEGIEDPGALAFDSEGNLFITTVGVNAEPAQGMIFKSPPEGGTVVPQEQWDCGDFEPQP